MEDTPKTKRTKCHADHPLPPGAALADILCGGVSSKLTPFHPENIVFYRYLTSDQTYEIETPFQTIHTDFFPFQTSQAKCTYYVYTISDQIGLKIGTRNVHVATAAYNYRFYFESLGVKHLEIPTCCSREE